MGRINLGAGSSGPRCSVFSRLAGFGLQMWVWGGGGHSSRWMRSIPKVYLFPAALSCSSRTWGPGASGAGTRGLHAYPLQHPKPQAGPRGVLTLTQEPQSLKAYASLHEQGRPNDLSRVTQTRDRQDPNLKQRV